MVKDIENEIYKKIRKLKEGNTFQRKRAIECEKILADERSNKNLNEKLNMIIDIMNRT